MIQLSPEINVVCYSCSRDCHSCTVQTGQSWQTVQLKVQTFWGVHLHWPSWQMSSSYNILKHLHVQVVVLCIYMYMYIVYTAQGSPNAKKQKISFKILLFKTLLFIKIMYCWFYILIISLFSFLSCVVNGIPTSFCLFAFQCYNLKDLYRY